MASPLPRDPAPDASIAFLREGYDFIRRRCERLGTDAFRARIGLRPVVCVRGPEAAEMFYGGPFTRGHAAMPPSTVSLLQDYGSVQSLDGEAHRARKATWMRMVASDGAVEDVVRRFGAAFAARLTPGTHRLHRLAQAALCEAACGWAGIRQEGRALRRRTGEMAAMIEGAGGFGPRQAKGQVLRARSEHWARAVMTQALADPEASPGGTPLRALATHRDADGRPLSPSVAAVELLNVIRPTVAVARYVVFSALHLHERPDWRERLGRDPALVSPFVTEMRRLAPFIPAMGGVAREGFTWRGHEFAEGDWVLLDLFGTSRDPGAWAAPDDFRPERFEDRAPTPYDVVPQGAGAYATTHRCPGERATVALTEAAVRRLLATDYAVPEQDLRVPLHRFPAVPRSGFVLEVSPRATP
ncbi:cytochrome P450 [Parvularcula dongshanensis]|uniref:Fatty-acid peroxygenase n=1 Tax=Parvularcula dongshanensis TaxID=1173995 RepID=A0A840HZB5_9PROT|nr:cytochrome P450 [Parvularcula dongshanensis]MBB4658186.1 fatty-acid peroxygenase [Parvularcula dongshanensis]